MTIPCNNESESVSVSRDGPVAIVTLSRPDVRNAVDRTTARGLYEAFCRIDSDDDVLVAVLHGAHGHFCAGWDLKAGAQADPADELRMLEWPADADGQQAGGHTGDGVAPQSPGPLGPMGPTRLQMSKPVIAAVSGAAVAGGMELALWCDLRVVEADAYLGVYCRRFGVPLIDGGTVRLPRIVGMGRALDLILSGRRVDATEALAMGLANRVVPQGQGLQAAIEWAHALAQFPQATMRADRASAYAQWDLPADQAMRQEWQRGRSRLGDAIAGAARFSAGEGRHGRF